MTSPDQGSGTLRIRSSHDEARRARRWVAGQMEIAGLSSDDRAECTLAFGEALSNVMRHAYEGRSGEPIDIEIEARRDAVRIVIRDQAPRAFSPPATIAVPEAEALAEGGYGIHLIHRIMDEVRYLRTADGINELHMSRFRASRRAAS